MKYYSIFYNSISNEFLFLDKAKNRRAFQKWKKGMFTKMHMLLLYYVEKS